LTTIARQHVDWGGLNKWTAHTTEQALAIQRIPAPTFFEADRARYVAAAFAEVGLRQIDSDTLHNVYGLLPGRTRAALLVTAHTDTVFDSATVLDAVHRDDGTITAPGLGDNSIGVAALISLAQFVREQGFTLPCDVHFVATTREEGLGDLGGMRAAFDRLRAQVGAVVNLEGLALGHIYNAGIAVRRLRIQTSADGGHSWLHFGQPSAIHTLMELGARIAHMRPPQQPRTTYNIGWITGGQSINSIASRAEMLLDLRSEQAGALAALEREVRQIVNEARSSKVDVLVEVIGDRPAGMIAPSHALVRAAADALSAVGIRGVLEAGSTDGNIPLAAGCPTVTVGVTRGGNAHRIDEYIETAPIADGLRQIALLVFEACHLVASGVIAKGA